MNNAALKNLPRLLLLACLLLPGLALNPHAAHAFWAPELLATRWLLPLAFLASWALPSQSRPPNSAFIKTGMGLLFLLIGTWLISTAFSLRWDLSLAELGLWLCYPMAFAMTWKLADSSQRPRILAFILLAGVGQSAYGLLQSMGWDPFAWNTSFGGRAGGFLGNPDFLGNHLALLLPVSLAWSLSAPKRTWLRWMATALILLGLAASGTRGAWAGAILGVGITVMVLRLRLSGLLTQNLKPLLILAVTLGIALAAIASKHPEFSKRMVPRLRSDAELSRRGVLMRSSLNLIKKDPWVGKGPGHLRIYFPTVQASGLAPELLATRPYITSEHSHNDLIQMAAEAGLPAALLLLALVAWVYGRLWQGLRYTGSTDQPAARTNLGLMAGTTGSLAALHLAGMVNFPFLIAPTQTTAWCLAALALRAALDMQGSGEEAVIERRGGEQLGWVSLALAAVVLLSWLAGRLFFQDMLWWVGEGEIKLGNFARGQLVAAKALTLDPLEDRLWYQKGLAEKGAKNLGASVLSFEEAVRLNPNYVEALWELGRARLDLQEPAQAEKAFLAAAARAPNLPEIWEPLANALFLQQKYEEAVKAFDWALYYHVNEVVVLGNKAAALGNLGRYDHALRALSEAETMDPKNAKVQLNRAVTFFKMGNQKMARLYLQKARSLDPDDPDIKPLEKALKK